MLAAIKQMISLTAHCIPSQPRPANLIMASSSFPQEKSVATHPAGLPGHTTWETQTCENIKTSLNDFRLCWRWWRDSPFFRGPGGFNDILAIVWHVIVKFYVGPRESTQTWPGVGTVSDLRLGEAARAQVHAEGGGRIRRRENQDERKWYA